LYRVSIYPQYQDSLSNALVDAVAAAAGRGLDVRVLIDDCRLYADSADANLAAALVFRERGVPVRFDDPAETTHAKLVIIDGETVVLGSTNWNYYSLERNVETNVALIGIPEVAAPYEAFFESLWCAGREIGS
jgi:phosphatidylserine/phosphatidylglycerophosphate/cardiolipin synthase-like enzyme